MGLEDRHKGVVSEIGLSRNQDSFSTFNLTIGVTVKTEKKMSYEEGERLANEFRKELLGKNVELGTVAVPCPVCGRTFNTEFGMKQHKRMVHKNGDKPSKSSKKKGEKATKK